MDKKKLHQCFPPSLFWDVDPDAADIDIHAGFIIERVITHGNFGDWTMLLTLYGKKGIRDEVVTIRSLDPKSLNYLSIYFNVKKVNFRCCN